MPAYNNKFQSPTYLEETIIDDQNKVIGTIRIKPASVSWKPSNERKFFTVSLNKFIDWIVDSQTATTRTKQ